MDSIMDTILLRRWKAPTKPKIIENISNNNMLPAKSYLPFRMGYLTDEMVKQAEVELNETEETRSKALAKLRQLIEDDKNLDILTDDAFLLQFLRARKFDAHKAMEVIRNFSETTKSCPEIYAIDLDYSSAKEILDANSAGVFPYRNKDGGAIFYFNVANWDPDKCPIEPAISVMTALVFYVANDPATQVCGSYLIYDAAYNLRQLRCISLSHLRLFSRGLRNTLPIRFKEIHVINESPVFRYLYNILKMFLSDKIKKRFHFHGSDLKQLQKHIPKEILPTEYGGENFSSSQGDFYRKDFSVFFDKYCEILSKGYK